MIKSCVYGANSMNISEFGFAIQVPEGNCILPNREFPLDTTIQIVPRGFYFVLNEYISGSIVNNTKATLIFEPENDARNVEVIMQSLRAGGFLKNARVSTITNSQGAEIVEVKNAAGIDGQGSYDWAFIRNVKKKTLLSVLLIHTDDSGVYESLLKTISFIE